jgi:hypothetical protein
MQAEAKATDQSPHPPVASKRNTITGIVVVIGMLLFGATFSFHDSQQPATVAVSDDGQPANAGGAVSEAAASGSTVASGPVTLTFHGYKCTVDCLGHEIGYKIARAEGKTRIGDCPSAPPHFRSLQEGCWAAVGREGPG